MLALVLYYMMISIPRRYLHSAGRHPQRYHLSTVAIRRCRSCCHGWPQAALLKHELATQGKSEMD